MKNLVLLIFTNCILLSSFGNEVYDIKIQDLKYEQSKVRVYYEAKGFCDVLFSPLVTLNSENEIVKLEIKLKGYKLDSYCKSLKAFEDFHIDSYLMNYSEKKPGLKVSKQLEIYLPVLSFNHN